MGLFRRLAGKEKVVDTTLAGKIATAGITADKLSSKAIVLSHLDKYMILSSKIPTRTKNKLSKFRLMPTIVRYNTCQLGGQRAAELLDVTPNQVRFGHIKIALPDVLLNNGRLDMAKRNILWASDTGRLRLILLLEMPCSKTNR